MTISQKLLFSFLMVGLGATGIVSLIVYHDSREALLQRAFEQLTSVKTLKKKKVEDEFLKVLDRAKQLASYEDLMIRLQNKSDREAIMSEFNNAILLDSLLQPIFSISSFDQRIIPKIRPTKEISDFITLDSLSSPVFYAIVPSKNGFLMIVQSFKQIEDILTERSGLGETGESYLVGEDYIMRSNSRFFQTRTLLNQRVETLPVKAAFSGTTKPIVAEDYRGIKVLSSFATLDKIQHQWVILSEMDYEEVFIPINQLQRRLVLITAGVSLIVALASVLISQHFSKPILEVKNSIEKLSQGDLSVVAVQNRKDEIGQMLIALSRLIEGLQRTRLFANEIGKRNTNADYQLLSERDELGQSLLQMKAELNRLDTLAEKERRLKITALLEGEEKERNRISRDLHDGIGQILTAINFQIQTLPESNKRNELSDLLLDAIDEVQLLSYNLMPRILMDFGLSAALKKLCTETAKHADLEIIYHSSVTELHRFSTQEEIGIFRIAQEALNNALKYAEASRIEVSLAQVATLSGSYLLSVSDNGKGFNEQSLLHKNGLQNMRERAALLGGDLLIHSEINHGTKVEVIVTLSSS